MKMMMKAGPQVEHADWSFVYITTLKKFGYYDDDGDDEDGEEEDEDADKLEKVVEDPMCIVYLGQPFLSKCIQVRLSSLRTPPFEGNFDLFKQFLINLL